MEESSKKASQIFVYKDWVDVNAFLFFVDRFFEKWQYSIIG
jgi:hypothetical protein